MSLRSIHHGQFLFMLLMLFLLTVSLAAQPVEYEIRFPNAVHHEAEITAIFTGVELPVLELRMSRTSPGRYALHEFAKNVYSLRATDSSGKALPVERPNPHQWDVEGHDGTVRVTYTLFGDRADGTYTAIDESHAHLNIPATFIWARGLERRSVSVRFLPPPGSGWRVASQLVQTEDAFVFTAPDLYYFMDSPSELSSLSIREWEVDSGPRKQTIRLAVHHEGTEAEVDAYAEVAKAVVLEETGIFGELPNFEQDNYTFIADYLPYVDGDGMEHRNSTILTSTLALRNDAGDLAGTLAHELFHAWSVERLRPASIEPFSFEEENIASELWFAEGFTSYFTAVILRRARIRSIDRFAEDLTGFLEKVLNSRGKDNFSPVEMSRRASFADGAAAVQPLNHVNIYTSYYPYGAAIGLGLDLTLRSRFDSSLDEYMKAMWDRFGRNETPYTPKDLEEELARVSGDPSFASDFFQRHILGTEQQSYHELLRKAGFELRLAEPEKASLGAVEFRFTEEGAVIEAPTPIGSPLYLAGLDRGAVIRKINDQSITDKPSLQGLFDGIRPGDSVKVEFDQRGKSGTVEVQLAPSEKLEVVPFEHLGWEASPEVLALRDGWLGSKAVSPLPELHRHCSKCKRELPFELDFCSFDGEALRLTLAPASSR